MKGIFLILLQCFLVFQLTAQNRYLEEVFTDVKVSNDIIYGRNATIFTYNSFGELIPEDLKMDVYEPLEDTLQERPLVLVFHDGNFLPPLINGSIIGTKTDSSVVQICTQLAKRGFTSAAVTYRQGWNPLAASQVDLTIGLIQAKYRGVQDGRTAIRFFKRNHSENENEFHIDPNRITIWGNGTGGTIPLNMTALSHIDDISSTTNSPGKFIYDSDGDGTPDTPMVQEEFLGDIEGKNLTIAPFDYLYINAGDTTNYENHSGYNSDFHLSVNVSGSVADVGWLDDNQVPTISIHSINDVRYPYDEEYFVIHPGVWYFLSQGSKLVGELQDSLGNNQAWRDGIQSDDPYTQQAILNSEKAEHPYYEGLYPYIDKINSNGFYEGVVIDWWDPNGTSPVEGPGMGMTWNEIPHPGSVDASYHDYALLTNENMSAEKAKLNIDTIMNYFAPRACLTLGLTDCIGSVLSSIASNAEKNLEIKLFPNPTGDRITIDAGNEVIRSIHLYDYYGQIFKTELSFNKKATMDLSDVANGIYVLKIQIGGDHFFKKVIVSR